MSEEIDQEDLSALGLLEDIARGVSQEDTAPVELPDPDDASEVLRRLYVEGLGLLAYGLQPAQPLPGTRSNLLSHLIGDETQEVSPLILAAGNPPFSPPAASRPAPPPEPPRAKAPRSKPEPPPAPEPPAAAPAAAAPTPQREASARPSEKRSRWPGVLAALFALAAAGLGVWAAMLQSEIAYRDTQLRDLGERLSAADSLKAELATTRAELAELEQRHGFVIAPATTVFALRPPEAGSLQPTARGHLFLAPDRRHWQLEVRGLKPEPEPQDYQLWFIVDGLPLSGGVFDARAGKTALLADSSLPSGTTSIVITLERKGGTASPTSPILLTATSSVQL